MSYPVIPDIARVQVQMQGATGLPTDVFVNNFYFRTAPLNTVDENAGAMAGMLDAFYGTAHGGAANSISELMPSTFNSVKYVFYDLGNTPPRYPVVPQGSSDPFIEASWLPSGGASTLPEEVALCCSFKAGDGPRRRGRVYLGPWIPSTTQNTGTRSRPTAALQETIQQAAKNMAESTLNSTWVVCSPTDAGAYDVLEGWVDNAWDTQRSRGAEPTARVTWVKA